MTMTKVLIPFRFLMVFFMVHVYENTYVAIQDQMLNNFGHIAFTVGKQTPCKLSFVYTSQVNLTVRTEPKFFFFFFLILV